MKKRLQIRDQKQNMTLTLILWLVLGAVSMGGMLHVAAHKTVVISARGQEQGEIVPEYRTGENGEMQLPMMTDHVADRQICIPLEGGECSSREPLYGKGTLGLHTDRQEDLL